MMFDIIVIGAGPAGSAAARRLASAGWRVALLEKSDEPGQNNICGGMVSLSVVEKHGVFPDAVEKVMRGELHVLPWGVIENTTEQCTVQRRVFDRMLAQRAVTAGAELMTRTRARAVRVTGSMRMISLSFARLSSTPSASGRAPPESPVAAPLATTGTRRR